MKQALFLIILLFHTALALPLQAMGETGATATCDISEAGKAKVRYSFDFYATNPKVQRTYISGEMLRAAYQSNMVQSSTWNFKNVAARLTSVLSLHTHSMSTTQTVRKDCERVAAKRDFEEIMSTTSGDKRIVVYGHRVKGSVWDEFIIFRFRSNYCSRVVQLTGKLYTSDITDIINLKK